LFLGGWGLDPKDVASAFFEAIGMVSTSRPAHIKKISFIIYAKPHVDIFRRAILNQQSEFFFSVDFQNPNRECEKGFSEKDKLDVTSVPSKLRNRAAPSDHLCSIYCMVLVRLETLHCVCMVAELHAHANKHLLSVEFLT